MLLLEHLPPLLLRVSRHVVALSLLLAPLTHWLGHPGPAKGSLAGPASSQGRPATSPAPFPGGSRHAAFLISGWVRGAGE